MTVYVTKTLREIPITVKSECDNYQQVMHAAVNEAITATTVKAHKQRFYQTRTDNLHGACSN